MAKEEIDALVIGGGFYGCCLALHLRKRGGLGRIVIVERESEILKRASFGNQARLHSGYHYPRSFTTAYRCGLNLAKFIEEYPESVERGFTQVYCVARRNSLMNARQFRRFCEDIGAPLKPVRPTIAKLLSRTLIEAAFEVREFAFNAATLRRSLLLALRSAEIELWLRREVESLTRRRAALVVTTRDAVGQDEIVVAGRVFNCTYAGLRRFCPESGRLGANLKFEVAEMAVVEVPEECENLGVTVMDGPFFSVMPFPERQLHTLSHVRYTPHISWTTREEPMLDPYLLLDGYHKRSRAGYMIRDAARYIPCLQQCRLASSLFEVKAVLQSNERDDGRPILIERHPTLDNVYSILGGKIDNVFDMLEFIGGEE